MAWNYRFTIGAGNGHLYCYASDGPEEWIPLIVGALSPPAGSHLVGDLESVIIWADDGAQVRYDCPSPWPQTLWQRLRWLLAWRPTLRL